jgi:hypothetical protein
MKFEQWNEIAELVGTLAVVASLVFVGLQLKQTQRQLEQEEKVATTEMNSSYVANLIESNDAIIQNMDIWLRGNAGEELGPEEQKIHALLVHMENEMAYFAAAALRRLEDDKAADLDAAIFAGFLHENPGARRVWRDREQRLGNYRGLVQPGELTTSSWVELIESHLAVIERQTQSSAP